MGWKKEMTLGGDKIGREGLRLRKHTRRDLT